MQSRRIFLKNGAFALVSLGFAPSFLARTAYAQGRAARARQLITIFQRGAVDGLSVVVPFGVEIQVAEVDPWLRIGRLALGDGFERRDLRFIEHGRTGVGLCGSGRRSGLRGGLARCRLLGADNPSRYQAERDARDAEGNRF